MKFLLFFTLLFGKVIAHSQECDESSVLTKNITEIAPKLLCQKFIDLQEKFEMKDGRSISVAKRIQNIDSLHSFYRSFPNFFYFLLDKQSFLPSLETKDFSGYISGDPHIENFGVFAFQGKNKVVSRLSMNDFDDGGQGYFASDLIRYLGSLDIYIQEEDPDLRSKSYHELIDGYIATIENNGKFEPSVTTQKIRKKSIKDSDNPLEGVDYESGQFTEKNLKKCLTNPAQERIHYVYERSGNGSSTDCYRRVKETGGSAGLARQYYLTEDKKVIEFKTLPHTPASAIMKTKQTPEEYSKRTQELIKLSLGKNFSENYYKNTPHQTQNFLMRTHSEGFKKLHPNKKKGGVFKLDKEKRWSIVNDQMKILGSLHSKSLDSESRETYIKALKKLQMSDWSKAIQKVKNQFSEYYKACKN